MSAKERAVEIYAQHIHLASADGRLFRKTVMDQMMSELGISLASAATLYNGAKKAAPVEGLGRAAPNKNVRKPGAGKGKVAVEIPDNECFSVLELVKQSDGFCVGRCQSFKFQGEAGETFDSKIDAWPMSTWVMIRGLGPNHSDNFKLAHGEEEIKRYEPVDA